MFFSTLAIYQNLCARIPMEGLIQLKQESTLGYVIYNIPVPTVQRDFIKGLHSTSTSEMARRELVTTI